MSDYHRIASAITYLEEHASAQPGLEELASHVHLSPFHFQRMFCRWAGISPKKLLQVLTVERAKVLLDRSLPLLQVSEELGLSSSSRLHDHFVSIEAMTPGEYKAGGGQLTVHWGVHETPFGVMFVAATSRGVCQADFLGQDSLDTQVGELVLKLGDQLPGALLREDRAVTRPYAEAIAVTPGRSPEPLSVHVAGSSFQIAVWRALLRIPAASLSTYSQIAAAIERPRAVRAVASAIAANPVAMLIPCHRVIRQSGALGGYRWGTQRKQMLQLWERAQTL